MPAFNLISLPHRVAFAGNAADGGMQAGLLPPAAPRPQGI